MSTHRSLTRIVTAVFLVIGTLAAAAHNRAFADEPVSIATDDTVVSVRSDGRVLLRYCYRDVPFKPYVQEFFTPSGVNVLRDAPHDHLHHHALMFAIKDIRNKTVHRRLPSFKREEGKYVLKVSRFTTVELTEKEVEGITRDKKQITAWYCLTRTREVLRWLLEKV